jgi:hypothetical protein
VQQSGIFLKKTTIPCTQGNHVNSKSALINRILHDPDDFSRKRMVTAL